MSANAKRLWTVGVCAGLLTALLACNLPFGGQPAPALTVTAAPEAAPSAAAEAVPLDPAELYPPPFAEYPLRTVTLPQASPPSYTLPVSLDGILPAAGVELTPAQRQALQTHGFVVVPPVPGAHKEFYQVYERLRYESGGHIYVTADAVLHVYHLLFSKLLRDLEQDVFLPDLQRLTQGMLAVSAEQYQTLRGGPLGEAALGNAAYFGVAARLLGLGDAVPPEAEERMQAELALIESAQGPAVSPIWEPGGEYIEDYSQYIPRGHYTRSAEMERYFRAMMWYGRMTFRLRSELETQRALLITLAAQQGHSGEQANLDLWKTIYEPIGFLVGKAEDPSIFEYGAAARAVYGEGLGLDALADPERLAQFRASARALPPPRVNSMWVWLGEEQDEATQGFRFMGQRFTLDAYIFGQLIWQKVGSFENRRDLPRGMDVLAAMGSQEAMTILEEMGETQYDYYLSQMDKVRGEVAALSQEDWTQNVYWGWLYNFQPLLTPKDGRYPAYMRTAAWQRKELNTALGSYTELKHDTLLYAKQVMAEMGGAEPEEGAQGYVEPVPEVYARLYALAHMTRAGLQQRGLAVDSLGALENLMDLLGFLQTCAEKELAGQALSPEERLRIYYFGGELEALTLAAADSADVHTSALEDQPAALVADVATGIGRVLEEAVGDPALIYVILPDEPYRLGAGAVYSYYEFALPSEERMTDETWRGLVAAGKTPPLPEWTRLFMPQE